MVKSLAYAGEGESNPKSAVTRAICRKFSKGSARRRRWGLSRLIFPPYACSYSHESCRFPSPARTQISQTIRELARAPWGCERKHGIPDGEPFPSSPSTIHRI